MSLPSDFAICPTPSACILLVTGLLEAMRRCRQVVTTDSGPYRQTCTAQRRSAFARDLLEDAQQVDDQHGLIWDVSRVICVADVHKIMPTKVSATRAPCRSQILSVTVPLMFESPTWPRQRA